MTLTKQQTYGRASLAYLRPICSKAAEFLLKPRLAKGLSAFTKTAPGAHFDRPHPLPSWLPPTKRGW